MWLKDTNLEGDVITLLPLLPEHSNALTEAACDGRLWELWYTGVPSKETMHQYIQDALKQKDRGESLPFIVVKKDTGKIIGSTRFCQAVPEYQRVEIGSTWYALSHQRTEVNTECKHLLLTYAFETLNCIAVEFRTHWHNQTSRNAITRLGAKQDGILRNHQIAPNGSLRDTVVFSILRDEWAAVKANLEFKMGQYK